MQTVLKDADKPNLESVLNILEMKNQATKLFDEIDKAVLEMKNKFGEGLRKVCGLIN